MVDEQLFINLKNILDEGEGGCPRTILHLARALRITIVL